MAATFTVAANTGLRGYPISLVTMVCDASYPTGGYAATSRKCGLFNLASVVPLTAIMGGYAIESHGLNVLVKQVSGNGVLTEVPAGTNLSNISIALIAFETP